MLQRRLILTIFLVLATLSVPVGDALGRAGGGQNYPGSGDSSGSDDGGRGTGSGWEALPGILGAIGAIAVLIYIDPVLGLSVLGGFIVLLYLAVKIQDWMDRYGRKLRAKENSYFSPMDWSNFESRDVEKIANDPVVAAAVSIMIADGVINEREYALVVNLAGRRGIGPETLTTILNSVNAGEVPRFSRRERRQAHQALSQLEEVLSADGTVNESEIELFKKIKQRLAS